MTRRTHIAVLRVGMLIGLAALALPSTGCAEAGSGPVVKSDVTAITNARIIDGNGGEPVADGVIVIRGERIEAIGPASSTRVPEEAHIIDAAGKTVMPGLADMHVHFLGGWDGQRPDMLGYQRYLDGLLYSGVTTFFDTGNVLPYIVQIRDELAAGRLSGPRVYLVGPVIDGPDPMWPPISYSLAYTAQIGGIVEQLRAGGVNRLKGYHGLSIPMVRTLVREAEAASLDVVVDHWAQNEYIDLLIRAGVTSFAHLPLSLVTEEALEAIMASDVSFLSTLAAYESFSRRRFGDLTFLEQDLVRNCNPDWALDELRAHAGADLSPQQISAAESSAASLANAQANLKRLHENGVLVAAGTDAPQPGVFMGEGLHRELELMVEAGLTPLEAIRTATRNAAEFIGEEKEWGTLEPGKLADLLIVDGSPAERIGDTRLIETVIQRGVILDRASLAYDPSKDPGFRTSTSVGG